MQKYNRRKTDEAEDPIIQLYWLIANTLGHAVAARIIEIIASGEDE